MDRPPPRVLKILAATLALQLGYATGAAAVATNPSFEDGDLTGWATSGNVQTTGTWRGIAPTDGSYQAILRTNGSAVAPSIAETALGLPTDTIQILFDTDLFDTSISTGSGPVEGSAIQQSFFADAGDILTFDWNFVTREGPPESVDTDFLWQHLINPDSTTLGGVLAHAAQPAGDFSNAQSPSFQQTGFQTFSFLLPQSGTYTFTAGVHDVQVTNRDSFGIFDNFFIVKAPEPGTAALLTLGLLGLARTGRRRDA